MNGDIEKQMHRIVQSFPAAKFDENVNAGLVYLLVRAPNKQGLQIRSIPVSNISEHYSLDEIFVKDFPVRKVEESNYSNQSKIITTSALVAKNSKRGMAKRYSVFPDHALLWYQGSVEADSPAIRIKNCVVLNPDFKTYFARIYLDGSLFTDEDHLKLETLGYTRIE